MVKCVVSGCPNRVVNVNVSRTLFHRPPKRFFNFPKDPARVKVWLAALRETDKQDSSEQHLICEDHFLPDDITTDGVNSDAIPIMPPDLDGPMGMISPWGAGSSEEEEQWAAGDGEDEDEEEEDDEGGGDAAAPMEPPAPEPQQAPDTKTASTAKSTGVSQSQKKERRYVRPRADVSLGVLTRRFLQLLNASPGGSMDLKEIAATLQAGRRRIYDITNILEGASLIERESANKFKWIGSCHVSSFLWKTNQKFQRELENLKLVEDTLDTLIKSCAQQLFDMTDDVENAALAYLTHKDISGLAAFQEQTLIVVKAPEETKLEVPAPTEDSIKVHLKGGKGPIVVLTCDIGPAGADGQQSGGFSSLEESRMETRELQTESSDSQSAVLNA